MGEALKDILGREFKVGQIVAYPSRKSSSMWMVTGEVVEVWSDHLRVKGDRRTVKVAAIDRVVIAQEVA